MCLIPLATVTELELDQLALAETGSGCVLDVADVDEDVGTAGPFDEAEALPDVEPLHDPAGVDPGASRRCRAGYRDLANRRLARSPLRTYGRASASSNGPAVPTSSSTSATSRTHPEPVSA